MYEALKDKKLLILGAGLTEVEIIKAAKKLGIYTITTDNHEDWTFAPAKNFSDEAWNISWSDIDALKEQCEKSLVDGVIAGFSEKRVIAANRLSLAINKPFYANNSNLSTITDKIAFKKACKECNIRVPLDYCYGDAIKFPVIVKPSDNGGSRGITICHNNEEFEIAYQKALSWSVNKRVVVEEYLIADEVMIYFTVHNGIVTLSAMCDRIMKKFGDTITQLPVGYFYSSKYYDIFEKYNFDKFKKLLSYLDIKNGLIAFQAFVIGNDIIPFDPTYRLDGTMTYHLTEFNNNISVMDMLIRYSLLGSMGNDDLIERKENPCFKRTAFEFPILLKKGMVRSIEGIEKVKEIPGVIYLYQGTSVGDQMEKEADFSQMLCRIFVSVNDIATLKTVIDTVFKLLIVLDENGDDMILYRFELDRLLSCY